MDRALRSHYGISRRDRAVLDRSLQHPDPRVQLYVAELIYQGERERAESRLAWEDEPPSDRMSAHEGHVLLDPDLAAVFREMEDGNYLEPSDDEFERAVHGWAQSHSID